MATSKLSLRGSWGLVIFPKPIVFKAAGLSYSKSKQAGHVLTTQASVNYLT